MTSSADSRWNSQAPHGRRVRRRVLREFFDETRYLRFSHGGECAAHHAQMLAKIVVETLAVRSVLKAMPQLAPGGIDPEDALLDGGIDTVVELLARAAETEAIHALWWVSNCDTGSAGALERFEQLLLQRAWLMGQDLSDAERSDWVRQLEATLPGFLRSR